MDYPAAGVNFWTPATSARHFRRMRPSLLIAILLCACGAPPPDPDEPAGALTLGVVDELTSTPLGPIGSGLVWKDVPLAGRAGLPANATAAYVSVRGCTDSGNPAFAFLARSSAMLANARSHEAPSVSPCGGYYFGAKDVWLPLDATQTIRVAGSPIGFTQTTGSASVVLLGWAAPQ